MSEILLYRGIGKEYDEEINDNQLLTQTTDNLKSARLYAGKDGWIIVYKDDPSKYYDTIKDEKKIMKDYEPADLEDAESDLAYRIRKLGFSGYKAFQQKYDYGVPRTEIEYSSYKTLKPIKIIKNTVKNNNKNIIESLNEIFRVKCKEYEGPLMLNYSSINYINPKVYTEAYTNIKSVTGKGAILALMDLYKKLKNYNENIEKGMIKDITKWALNIVVQVKPESKGYVKRFEETGRKILVMKDPTDSSFVGYTSNNEGFREDIIMNVRNIGSIEHFEHEFIHLVQYIEIYSKYKKGTEIKLDFLSKETKNDTPAQVVNYAIRPEEFEKSISLYISEMHNYKSTGNYTGILKKIFKEVFNDYPMWRVQILRLLLNKPALKTKILKRLYREGIKYIE